MNLLDCFIRHQVVINRSRHTVRSYSSDVIQFMSFISDSERDIESIETIHIRQFLAYLSMKGLSAKSISRKLSSLKAFFLFLFNERRIANNPAQNIISPKLGKRLPNILTLNEFHKMINEIDSSTLLGKRDRAILEMLYSSGLRSEEILSIDESDLRLKEGEVYVRGKGGRERVAFYSEETKRAFLDYIPLKRVVFPESSNLFINRFGSQLSTRFLRKMVSSYSKMAGIEKDITPHMFRHSFATTLLDNGVDLKIIKEFLGHSSISSTQIYTHLSREELRKSYLKYAPS